MSYIAVARPQFSLNNLSQDDRILLFGLLTEAKVNIVAGFQELKRYVFAVGFADPFDPRNEAQSKEALRILKGLGYNFKVHTAIEVVAVSTPPGTLYNVESRIVAITPILLNYIGESNTLWFQVAEGDVKKVLADFKRDEGCQGESCLKAAGEED